MDVLRRERALEDDARLDVGHLAGALELFQDHAAIRGQHLFPIVMRAQIRRVDEHVERFAAGGRGAGLGAGRRGEVAGRVGRGLALLVDEIELLVRIAAEDEVVMREVLVALVQAEVEHDAGAGGLVFAPPREGRADRAVDQFAMRADGVAIRDDGARARSLRPSSVRTPVTSPPCDRIFSIFTPVRNSTPSSRASFSSASGTARVPPIGYQTPSSVCMCAMPQSTAGEP